MATEALEGSMESMKSEYVTGGRRPNWQSYLELPGCNDQEWRHVDQNLALRMGVREANEWNWHFWNYDPVWQKICLPGMLRASLVVCLGSTALWMHEYCVKAENKDSTVTSTIIWRPNHQLQRMMIRMRKKNIWLPTNQKYGHNTNELRYAAVSCS